MSKIKPQIAFLFFFTLAALTSRSAFAQSVFYLESTDGFDGTQLNVEYRVFSVNSGKSFTIKNVEGLLFFELPALEDIKIRVIKEGYYVEEKIIASGDLKNGETLKFLLEKRPTAKLVLNATDGETGKAEPASFDIFFEGRMLGRGTTSRSQAAYELLVEQDGTYQVVVHAKAYDDSKASVPVQISSPQNIVNQSIPLFKPAKEVAVRLVDEQKGNPVKANVEIKLSDTGEVLYTGSPDNGLALFTFRNGKNYTITAGSEKFNQLEKKIEGSQKEDLILRLRPNTYVEFKIISKATGKPIAAEVVVKTPSGQPVVLNQMSFVPKDRGDYRVEVNAPGYVPKSGSFTVNTFTGGAMEVLYDLDLADQQYHVKVIDKYTKELLDGLEFRVFGPKAQQLPGVTRNDKGEYVFITDPTKEYFIESSKEDYAPLTKMLNEKEKSLTLEMMWSPEVTYTLKVVDQQTNAAVTDAKVQVRNSQSKNLFVLETETKGLFKIKMPKNETYSYFVDASGYEPGIVGVNTRSGNNIDLLVARSDQQAVEFTAVDYLTGKPVDASMVYTLGGKKMTLKKSSAGAFSGDFTPSNNYEIEVIASGYATVKEEVKSSLIQARTYPVKLKKESYLVRFKIENISDNQELRKVTLKISNASGARINERFAAAEKAFEASLQADLAYTVQASAEGFEAYESNFTLQDLVASNLNKSIALIPLPPKEEIKIAQEPAPAQVEPPAPMKEEKRIAETPILVKEEKKPAEPVKVFEKPASELPSNSEAMAAEFNKPESVGKRYLLDEVYFDQSSAAIREDEVSQLNELAGTLKNNTNLVVEIVGYTDNVGDPRLNLGLSQFRAKAVANYLFYKGAQPEKIKSRGLGQEKPVADNDSEDSRARNRRVELVLIEN